MCNDSVTTIMHAASFRRWNFYVNKHICKKHYSMIYEIIPCATYITVNQNNDNSNIDRKQIIIFLV